MGGQVGDAGEIHTDQRAVFVVDTTRAVGGYILHIGHVKSGTLSVTDSVTATVMGGRDRTEKNHTGTHLANWALRETLGEHVQQKGSLVDPDKLRFDFSHPKAMTEEEVGRVETLVRESIGRKLPVYTEVAPQEQALKIHGLRAVFGEKYPAMVRVVSIGAPVSEMLADPANPKWQAYSIEFCGGTHLMNSAETESFAITSEESVSKGIRRLVALTGAAARDALGQAHLIESLVAESRTAADASLPGAIAALQKALAGGNVPLRTRRAAQAAIGELQARHKNWQKTHGAGAAARPDGFSAEALLTEAEAVNGIALVVATVPAASADTLRNTWDWLKKKHPAGNIAALLAGEFVDQDKDGNALPAKVNMLAAVGDPLIGKLKAGDWIKAVAPIVGGSGGGRPQMAMAGGKDVAKIGEALTAGKAFARGKLA